MSDTSTTTPRYRPVSFGVTRVSVRDGAAGVRYVQAELPLGAYARRLSDFLVHWAETEPDRTFMARRVQLGDARTGDWQHISYAQALEAARRIGQALLDRKLTAERPVVILSENTLEHALMSLGCLYAGVCHRESGL
jgi:feruloyl-CoA synthase